jgi:hypothetical protein
MSTIESIECVVDSVRRKNTRVIRIKLKRAEYTQFPLVPENALFFETKINDGAMACLTVGDRVFLTLSDSVPELAEEEEA